MNDVPESAPPGGGPSERKYAELRLLSGDEAAARGAFEAGVRVVSAYPGTPATEIAEALGAMPGVYAEWATNEKVALDVAIGAAYAGARSMAVMKHVGLNVAMDSLMYASMTGAAAGLVVAVGDDPGMFSSQNEQDTRYLARFARLPCLEPSDSQEAKDMTAAAFDLSERFDVPVILRMTTRICHSSSPVELGARREVGPKNAPFPRDIAKYVMIPANARKANVKALARTERMREEASDLGLHRVEPGDRALGIITAGVAYQYARGLSGRVGAEARDDVSAAGAGDPRVRLVRRARDRAGGARAFPRRVRAPARHRRARQGHLSGVGGAPAPYHPRARRPCGAPSRRGAKARAAERARIAAAPARALRRLSPSGCVLRALEAEGPRRGRHRLLLARRRPAALGHAYARLHGREHRRRARGEEGGPHRESGGRGR